MIRIRHLSTHLRRAAIVLATVALAAGLASSAGAKDERPGVAQVEPSTLLVRFTNARVAAAAIRAEGDRSIRTLPSGVHVVRITRNRALGERMAAYQRRQGVLYAEPNRIRSIQLDAPDDPSYDEQWGLPAIRAVDGWSIFPASYAAGLAPKIAVLDTGVLPTHPDLAANLDTANGATCTSGTCTASAALDDNGHGTHVTGIVGAVTNNGVGIAGVGLSSPIMPVKVLGAGGSGSDASVASGIAWAVSRGARVLNLSLGAPGFSQTICDAVTTATNAGAVVIASAGNSGSAVPFYPAACPGAIGVAATASDGSSPSFSNWGERNVFLSAPGAEILSTTRTSSGDADYGLMSGTSMAAPHVSGVASLLLGQTSSRTPAALREILARTAEKLGEDLYPPLTYGDDPNDVCAECTWHPYYGYGELDAHAALCSAAEARIEPGPVTSSVAGSSVTLTGPGVGCATSVSLDLVAATYTVDSPTQITATVPSGVGFGYWRVTTGGGTAVSPHVFTVSSPNIEAFAPANARPGSTVVLEGTGFSDATSVTLGFVAASFTVVSPTRIDAVVPAGVDFGRWRVGNSVWTAVHPLVFNAVPGRRAVRNAPYTGAAGSQVQLDGAGFGSATAVFLDSTPASFTVRAPDRIVVTVPAGVGFGHWRVTTPSGTTVDPYVFTVSSPAITSFSGPHGAAGSAVVITGTGFSDATSVSLGNVAAQFTVDSPTQITATVPAGLAFGRWRVGNGVFEAVHPLVFSVP